MTRWARYLADVHFQDLVDVVATPDAEVADPVSRATRVVWDTMAQLARRSQQTVKHCGNGIRMAAVSTMPNRTPFQPLRAYMDEKSIQDHARPWQQILVFIIRTQTSRPWTKKKPTYVMTARQQKTWRRLWQMAQAESERQIEPQSGVDEPRSSPDPMDPDENPRVQSFVMSPIETACLEFCIELLNQRIKVHEYESPLVCAMAVLGWGERHGAILIPTHPFFPGCSRWRASWWCRKRYGWIPSTWTSSACGPPQPNRARGRRCRG
ncbi:hypothetical protein BDW75DRAFT_224458 [Aspergillus navahoensis]